MYKSQRWLKLPMIENTKVEGPLSDTAATAKSTWMTNIVLHVT